MGMGKTRGLRGDSYMGTRTVVGIVGMQSSHLGLRHSLPSRILEEQLTSAVCSPPA